MDINRLKHLSGILTESSNIKEDDHEMPMPSKETDYAKTFKTPYGEVAANWSFYSGGFDDFDADDKKLQAIINDMQDEYDEIDHDNVRAFIKAAMKKRRAMKESEISDLKKLSGI